MTGRSKNNVQGFLQGVENVGEDFDRLKSVLSDISQIDERLKSTLQRMEETEQQMQAALALVQQLGGASTGDKGASGLGEAQQYNRQDNRRNDGQWQSALARIVFGNDETNA